MRRYFVWLLIVAFMLSITPAVFAAFTPPSQSGITQEDMTYADKVWPKLSWDISRAIIHNEVSLKLPKVDYPYSWAIYSDVGKYVGINVEWKSSYLGHGGQDIVIQTNPGGTGFYIDIINVPNGAVVSSETYIYKPDTGIKYIPPEQRVIGAIDDKGNITGLYDVWGKQIVNDSVYSHQINSFITFPDVNASSWAYNVIYKMAAAGYINGYPDRSFKPDSDITRAEFTVVLNKIFSDKYSDGATASSDITFSDLKPSYWSYQATNHLFRYMVQNDVINIFGDKFYPDNNITREEAAAVLYSTLKNNPKFEEYVIQKAPFIDTGFSKYLDGINFCYSEGLMVGYPNKLFKPKAKITRTEIAALMCKVYDLIQSTNPPKR